jgi:hypothetical protein
VAYGEPRATALIAFDRAFTNSSMAFANAWSNTSLVIGKFTLHARAQTAVQTEDRV